MADSDNKTSERFGYARIEVSRGSCYGSPALTTEIKFESDDRVSVEFSDGLSRPKIVALERAEAESFLLKIFGIIEKPEVLSGLRHVEISYHVEIEWENFALIGNERSGKFKAFSNEWFTDEIEEFINYEAETTEIAERFLKILDTKPHRHALEIYRTVKYFHRKNLM